MHVRQVGIVGLGTIARTHLEVLARLPETEVLFGVEQADVAAPRRDRGA